MGVLDDGAFAAVDRPGSHTRRPAVLRLHRPRLLDPVSDHQAALSATGLDPAAERCRAAAPAASGTRMARQMVDARRAGAGADDLLHQEPGSLRRGEPVGGLLLHRRRAPDDPGLRLAARGGKRETDGPNRWRWRQAVACSADAAAHARRPGFATTAAAAAATAMAVPQLHP